MIDSDAWLSLFVYLILAWSTGWGLGYILVTFRKITDKI